jgi:hypothetical protein
VTGRAALARTRQLTSQARERLIVSFLSAAAARLKSNKTRNAVIAAALATSVGASVASCSPPSNPRTIAKNIMFSYGWGDDTQFNCLNNLWMRESGWNPYAMNPYSGAYGIPQALPASKMASAGPDWQTNPATQINWGLSYIRADYGTPCGAWGHSLAYGWY